MKTLVAISHVKSDFFKKPKFFKSVKKTKAGNKKREIGNTLSS